MTEALQLRLGERGDAVRDLQQRLRRAGFDLGDAAHAAYDEPTEVAVQAFQRSRGLVDDGVCGSQTWASLVEASFALGDRLLFSSIPMLRGDDVAELQRRLGGLGFDAGRVDGIFGPDTQRALDEFQRNAGVTADQICGPATVSALLRLGSRSGTASVAGVRERERLRSQSVRLDELRVVLGHAGGLDALAGAVGNGLQRHGAVVTVLNGSDWSKQAAVANRFNATLYLGVSVNAEPCAEVAYFATEGFESVGGRRLATLVTRRLPAIPPVPAAHAAGMRTSVLRETRAPAVTVRLGPTPTVVRHLELVATALQDAVRAWTLAPVE